MMLSLTGAMAESGLLPVPLAGVIIGRDVILLTAAFYYRYATLPPPFTWKRYFDVTMPTAEVAPAQAEPPMNKLSPLHLALRRCGRR